MARAAGIVLVLAASLAASSASADRVHGIVKSLDGQMLTIKNDNAKTVVIQLDPAAKIVHNRRLALTDIQPGVFVGTFAITTTDKKLRAQGVRVFADAMRGIGEGQYPMASNAARLMTYGAVAGVTPQPGGGVLKLTFRAAGPSGDSSCTGRAPTDGTGCLGSADIIVARGVPILSVEGGDVSMLVPGAVVSAETGADATGLTTATAITIERDAPPPKD